MIKTIPGAGIKLAAANAWTAAQTFSAGIILPAGGDITFTGTTGTNDIVLVNALADALSITDGSADILVIDTNTSGNVATFTAAVNLSGTLDAESYAAIGNGEALDADYTLIVARDFTVASGSGSQFRVDGVITAAADQNVYGAEFKANLTTPASSTNAIVAQVLIAEPTITEGDTVTTGVSLYVEAAPTEGASNYALWVDAGTSRFDGDITLDGDLDFTGPQEITTSSTDLTLNPARNTVLAKAAVLSTSELTISSGAVTVTSNYHTIDTEGDAATDDLNTISGAQAGQFLFLQPAASARDVTIKNGGGNIYTRDGADVTMTSTSTPLLLLFDNGSLWRVVGGQAGL